MNDIFVFPRKYKNRVRASRTHRPELFLLQSWVRSTRPMDNLFIYLLWPQANWSWNIYWIFHTDSLVFFSVARVLFKYSCERPVASILFWKIERPFRVQWTKVFCVQDAHRDARIAINFAIPCLPTHPRIQHSGHLSEHELQPPTTVSSIDESIGGSWPQRYRRINNSLRGTYIFVVLYFLLMLFVFITNCN